MPKTDVLCFHDGQVWQSPKGTFYRVERVVGGQATLRVGLEGAGRLVRRGHDRTNGWTFIAPLVTPSLVESALNGEFS